MANAPSSRNTVMNDRSLVSYIIQQLPTSQQNRKAIHNSMSVNRMFCRVGNATMHHDVWALFKAGQDFAQTVPDLIDMDSCWIVVMPMECKLSSLCKTHSTL